MSVNKGIGKTVMFVSGDSFGQFSHPVPLPPQPLFLDGHLSIYVRYFQTGTGLALLVANTAVAPIERVHLLLQNQNEMIKSGRISAPYKGMKDCLRRTIEREGIISLWRGNSVNVFKVLTSQALAFAIYKNYWHELDDNKNDKYGDFKFQAAVGSATLYQYPLDYARTRLANDVKAARRVQLSLDSAREKLIKDVGTRQFTGVFDVWKQTLKKDGMIGLYRGYSLSILGILAWDYTNKQIEARDVTQKSAFPDRYITTIMFHSVPVALYPVTCVSRRMMMNSGEATTKYKNSVHALCEIVKQEGVCSLYKGVTAGMIHCFSRILAISAAFSLGMYLNNKFNRLE